MLKRCFRKSVKYQLHIMFITLPANEIMELPIIHIMRYGDQTLDKASNAFSEKSLVKQIRTVHFAISGIETVLIFWIAVGDFAHLFRAQYTTQLGQQVSSAN